MTLAVHNAATVIPVAGEGPVRGSALAEQPILETSGVGCEGDRISSVGDPVEADVVIDALGCTVIPGFVDPHTHLPFYGWRADEDGARLSGVRYETIHTEEGGIFRSRRLLSEASDDDVLAFSTTLAREMLHRGTTTFETKSGYGLSIDAELRQMRLARALDEIVPQRVVSTCLAAHAVPRGRSEGEWIGIVSDELLPKAAADGLVTACDIYVESIAFALEHAARLATACESLGLHMRVHADQLADNQTASFAARWGFRSADHLNHTSLDGVGDLGGSDTAAVLLPGATFTLRQAKKPPARDLIQGGAIVALGTDLNPGTSPIFSMPFVIALACRIYGLRPMEALVAATANAAYVLGLSHEVGRLASGYRADLVILDCPSFDHVAYRPDHDFVLAVVCGGKIAYLAPGADERVTGL
ncbi:MAG: imidazolonepropionase [Actinomycetota bacterium]